MKAELINLSNRISTIFKTAVRGNIKKYPDGKQFSLYGIDDHECIIFHQFHLFVLIYLYDQCAVQSTKGKREQTNNS